MRADRYASFDQGDGARFEKGELIAGTAGSTGQGRMGNPKQISGKQELYELIINQYIK